MTRARKRRQYQSGSVYQRSSDGRWLGTIEAGFTKTGARRRITVSAKTEADAKAKLKQKQRALSRGEEGGTRLTVKAWSEKWLAETQRTVRPKTYTTDLGAVKAWIVPTIGHKRLDALTPTDIRAVRDAITTAGHTTSTASRYHGTLHRMLQAAHTEGHPIPPRVLDVKAPTPNTTDRTAIPIAECLTLLAAASELPHGTRWVAAFLQGMRQGEALGLTWPAITGDIAEVSWQLQALPYRDKNNRKAGFRIPDGYEARQVDRGIHLVRPKSKAGWRTFPLVTYLADGLEKWRILAPESPHGLVWPNPTGGPTNIRKDTAEWQTLQDRANVRHPAGRYYHVHEIRHSTASLLLELKVPEPTRIAIMGHSSIASTRSYEHVDAEQVRAALNQMATRLQLG